MKLYKVIYEEYYDDFSTGGEFIKGSWLYKSKENAIKKVAKIKPEIYEDYKEEAEKLEAIGNIVKIDTPEHYAIKEKGGMCYWGSSVYVSEVETED